MPRSLSNPDLYKEHFIAEAMREVPVVGVSGASSKRPKVGRQASTSYSCPGPPTPPPTPAQAPAFVWLSPLPPSWPSLQSIVPNILHLGVIGTLQPQT